MCLLERFCPDWHNVAEQFSKVKNDILKFFFSIDTLHTTLIIKENKKHHACC